MRRVLAISPHLDDAALSAGATLADFAAQGIGVEILTLFAGSPHEPLSEIARGFHAKWGLPLDASAVAARRDEDRAAMRELGAHAHHVEFPDAIYRRDPQGNWLCGHERAIFDDLPLDQGGLLTEVTREVRAILSGINPDLVLTCAAVGDHVDHRLTNATVLDAVAGTEIPILLWEDLPYAVGHPPSTTPSRTRPLTAEAWDRKWRAITCYPTQVRMLWPAGTDWAAQLLAHAQTRGHGHPTELLLPPSSFDQPRLPR